MSERSAVYGIYDRDGNLRYIGSTAQTVERRFETHLSKSRQATAESSASPLRKWIHNVGADNVSVRPLVFVEEHMRIETEKKAIKAFEGSDPPLLNVWHTPRGADTMREIGARPEVKAKRLAKLKGRPVSEETRRRISENARKQDLSLQVDRMLAARRGSKNTPEHNEKIRLRAKHQWHRQKDTYDADCRYCVEGETDG